MCEYFFIAPVSFNWVILLNNVPNNPAYGPPPNFFGPFSDFFCIFLIFSPSRKCLQVHTRFLYIGDLRRYFYVRVKTLCQSERLPGVPCWVARRKHDTQGSPGIWEISRRVESFSALQTPPARFFMPFPGPFTWSTQSARRLIFDPRHTDSSIRGAPKQRLQNCNWWYLWCHFEYPPHSYLRSCEALSVLDGDKCLVQAPIFYHISTGK